MNALKCIWYLEKLRKISMHCTLKNEQWPLEILMICHQETNFCFLREGRTSLSLHRKKKKFWPPLRDFTTKMGIDWPLNSSSFTEPVSSQMTWRAGSLFTAAVPLLMGEETQGHNYEIRKWCKNPLTTFDFFLWQIRNFFCVGVAKKWRVVKKMGCQMDFINFELMKFDTPYFKSWFQAEMMSFSLDNHSIFQHFYEFYQWSTDI